MAIDHVCALLTNAANGGFQAVVQQMQVSQSMVSARMQRFELEFQACLFKRSGPFYMLFINATIGINKGADEW